MTKNKNLTNNWEKIIGENLPKIKVASKNVDWVFELLGWKKDARRN